MKQEDFSEIEKICEANSEMINTFVDEFLIYFCSEREGLDRQFARQFGKYAMLLESMPEDWPMRLAAQYLAFQLFKKDGYAKKYVFLNEIRSRSEEEKLFLSEQIAVPWRFTFCTILSNPETNFFVIEDIPVGEEYFLYSPGLQDIVEKEPGANLFLYLIGFNGKCWQSYGPHVYYKGFLPHDILFFSKMVKPGTNSIEKLGEAINANPLPFCALFARSSFPLSVHGKDLITINQSEFRNIRFFPDKLSAKFSVAEKDRIFKIELKRWNHFPHFAACYFNLNKKHLVLHAMTARGYDKLIEELAGSGYEFPKEPQNEVSMNMIMTAEEIFGKKINLNPYEVHFVKPETQEQSEGMSKINEFVGYLMEANNSKMKFDLEKSAEKCGLDIENAKSIAEQLEKMLSKYNK